MAETEERENDVPMPEQEGLDGNTANDRDKDTAPQAENEEPRESACDERDAEYKAALKQRDEYKDALIRERADFENYKKRNASLASTSFDNGVESAVIAVLPVLDNFERALAAECSDKQFASGMEMTMRQLQSALQGLGVEAIAEEGAFDPTRHHAIAQTENPDIGSNVIAETLQKGYTLKGRVIRPAMVKVNK